MARLNIVFHRLGDAFNSLTATVESAITIANHIKFIVAAAMEMVNAVHRVDEQTSRRGHGDDPRGQKGDYNETILQRTVELYRQLNINIKEVMWFGEFRRITVPDGTDIKQLPNAIRRSLGVGEPRSVVRWTWTGLNRPRKGN